jgi:hypothetical protein
VAGNPNSIFYKTVGGQNQQMDVWFCCEQEPLPRGTNSELKEPEETLPRASPKRDNHLGRHVDWHVVSRRNAAREQ